MASRGESRRSMYRRLLGKTPLQGVGWLQGHEMHNHDGLPAVTKVTKINDTNYHEGLLTKFTK